VAPKELCSGVAHLEKLFQDIVDKGGEGVILRDPIAPLQSGRSTGFLKHKVLLHYTTLHYTTLHYTTLHYTALHYTTLHYTTLHYTALHYTTLHYTTLHYTTLHYTTLHYITLHYTTLHYTKPLIFPLFLEIQRWGSKDSGHCRKLAMGVRTVCLCNTPFPSRRCPNELHNSFNFSF